MGKLCSRFLGQKAGCRAPTNPPKGGEDGGALFAVRVQILLSITSFAVQGLSESRIYPRLQSWWSALVQCRTVPRRKRKRGYKLTTKLGICHGEETYLRALERNQGLITY